jgi:PIN domain nuclease of toxin-antitoxin system
VSDADLTHLREQIASSPELSLQPIDEEIVDATTSIPRKVLGDPWDRFIVATALTLGLSLVTRDSTIRNSELVQTIW